MLISSFRKIFVGMRAIGADALKPFGVVRMLEGQVCDQMTGTQASIGAGALRAIRVFVLGGADNQ